MRRTSWSGAWASNISSEATASVHAQYVGTRAVNQPYLTQVNGYQTVCQGCFAPFPYDAADRSEVWRRDTILHRREQSLPWPSTDRRRSASDTVCKGRSTTPGAVAWTRSRMADSCSSPPARFFLLCRENCPGLWPLRLRHPAQSQRAVRVSVADSKSVATGLGMR